MWDLGGQPSASWPRRRRIGREQAACDVLTGLAVGSEGDSTFGEGERVKGL